MRGRGPRRRGDNGFGLRLDGFDSATYYGRNCFSVISNSKIPPATPELGRRAGMVTQSPTRGTGVIGVGCSPR